MRVKVNLINDDAIEHLRQFFFFLRFYVFKLKTKGTQNPFLCISASAELSRTADERKIGEVHHRQIDKKRFC